MSNKKTTKKSAKGDQPDVQVRKDAGASKKTKKLEPAPSGVNRIKQFFSELKFEWQKLTFPTKKELIQSTIVVFLFTIILMVIISAYDAVIGLVFKNYVLPPAASVGILIG